MNDEPNTQGHSGRIRLCLPLPVRIQTLEAPTLKLAGWVSLWKVILQRH